MLNKDKQFFAAQRKQEIHWQQVNNCQLLKESVASFLHYLKLLFPSQVRPERGLFSLWFLFLALKGHVRFFLTRAFDAFSRAAAAAAALSSETRALSSLWSALLAPQLSVVFEEEKHKSVWLSQLRAQQVMWSDWNNSKFWTKHLCRDCAWRKSNLTSLFFRMVSGDFFENCFEIC